MEYVYEINRLLVEAKDPPEAAKFARLLGETGFPALIVRPTLQEKADAALNSARALKIISDALIRKEEK